jgi:hypothetical protein
MKRIFEVEFNLTYEEIANEFWNMDSEDQAKFFNHIGKNRKFDVAMQLEYIRQEEVLNTDGRELMKAIGDYAYND